MKKEYYKMFNKRIDHLKDFGDKLTREEVADLVNDIIIYRGEFMLDDPGFRLLIERLYTEHYITKIERVEIYAGIQV